MTSEQQLAADAAVAEKLGWERRDAPSSSIMPRHGWQRRGRSETWQPDAPRYVSGGDWRLLGEMWEALWEWAGRFDVGEGAICHAYSPHSDTHGIWCYPDVETFDSPVDWVFDVDGATLGIALYRAGAAAGLWPSVTKEIADDQAGG